MICFFLVKYPTQSVQPRASGCPENIRSGVLEGDISLLNPELGTDVRSHLWRGRGPWWMLSQKARNGCLEGPLAAQPE